MIQGVGDFDGDRKADILWRQKSSGTASIWLMNGGTIMSYAGGWTLPSDWVMYQIGDFNGDGKSDLVWQQTSTGIISIWLMSNGVVQSYGGGWAVASDWVIQSPPPRTITLTWQDNSADETGFKIERSLDGSTNWIEIGSTGANIVMYQDIGLAPSTTYYYRVRAYNATGASAYSNAISATTR